VEPTTYILPIRSSRPAADELIDYLNWLCTFCDVIVVDGSPPSVFAALHSRCDERVQHVPPDSDTLHLLNGKVAGVLTGLRRAARERVIIADDDVRYDAAALEAVSDGLECADVVRPQNYFDPLPWHARIDTGRSLINRVTGGDWPGTLAVRRSTLRRTGGYDGNVLFENLELVRTIAAAGGRELNRPDIFVRRLPPSARHYFSQRIRQAYDEFARPARLFLWLSLLPLLAVIMRAGYPEAIAAIVVLTILAAEAGRRIDAGRQVFPMSSSLLVPVWLLERGVSAWLALVVRVVWGGVPYRSRVIRSAATSMAKLTHRHRPARGALPNSGRHVPW
jgi:hypothetical protein